MQTMRKTASDAWVLMPINLIASSTAPSPNKPQYRFTEVPPDFLDESDATPPRLRRVLPFQLTRPIILDSFTMLNV